MNTASIRYSTDEKPPFGSRALSWFFGTVPLLCQHLYQLQWDYQQRCRGQNLTKMRKDMTINYFFFFHVLTATYTVLNKEKPTLRLTKAIQYLHEQQVGVVECQKHQSTIGSRQITSCQRNAGPTRGGHRNILLLWTLWLVQTMLYSLCPGHTLLAIRKSRLCQQDITQ